MVQYEMWVVDWMDLKPIFRKKSNLPYYKQGNQVLKENELVQMAIMIDPMNQYGKFWIEEMAENKS